MDVELKLWASVNTPVLKRSKLNFDSLCALGATRRDAVRSLGSE